MTVSFETLDDTLARTIEALGGRVLVEGPIAGRTSAVDFQGRAFTVTWQRGKKNRPPHVSISTPHATGGGAATSGVDDAGYRGAVNVVDPRPTLLRAESAIDRFGKRIGLNRELQTGDAGFDDRVYVESDDADEQLATLLRPTVRASVQTILDAARDARITLYDDVAQRLQVLLPVHRAEQVERESFAALLDTIARIVEHAPPVERSGRSSPRDPRKLATISILVFSILSVPFVIIADATTRHVGYDLVATGFLVAFAAWLLAVPLLALLYRRRSTALRHFVLGTVLLMVGLPCFATASLTVANAAGVETPLQRHELEVLEKWRTTGKSTSYYLRTRSYRPGESELRISLRYAEFQNLPYSGRIVLTTREGRLGFDVLVSIATAP